MTEDGLPPKSKGHPTTPRVGVGTAGVVGSLAAAFFISLFTPAAERIADEPAKWIAEIVGDSETPQPQSKAATLAGAASDVRGPLPVSIDARSAPQLEAQFRQALDLVLAGKADGPIKRIDIAIGPASFQGERRSRVVMNFALAGKGDPQLCSQVIDYSTAALFSKRAAARIEDAIIASNSRGAVTCN